MVNLVIVLLFFRQRSSPSQRSTSIPFENKCRLAFRIATFKGFGGPVDPLKLAECGFFFTEYKDKVECFCCGRQESNWTIFDDVTDSKWHFDDCEMARGLECGNIPLSIGIQFTK